jgi:hypothetical protein
VSLGLQGGTIGCWAVLKSLLFVMQSTRPRLTQMTSSLNEYYVFTSRRGDNPERWSWEIRRKIKPLGVKLTADGFRSDAAAQFAGKKALEDFLNDLSKEERRIRK